MIIDIKYEQCWFSRNVVLSVRTHQIEKYMKVVKVKIV